MRLCHRQTWGFSDGLRWCSTRTLSTSVAGRCTWYVRILCALAFSQRAREQEEEQARGRRSGSLSRESQMAQGGGGPVRGKKRVTFSSRSWESKLGWIYFYT